MFAEHFSCKGRNALTGIGTNDFLEQSKDDSSNGFWYQTAFENCLFGIQNVILSSW